MADILYVASYLLATRRVHSSPTVKDIKKILGSVGIEEDENWLKKGISELNGESIDHVLLGVLESSPLCLLVGCGCFCCPWLCSSCCWFCLCCSKGEERREESKDSDDDDMGFALFD